MARRLKAWVEAVLAEPSGAQPALRLELPPRGEAAPSGAPVGWVREVQGLKSGPPADWAEFVRRNARNVPAHPPSRGSAPRTAPVEPPSPQPSLSATREVRSEEEAATVVPLFPRRESPEGPPVLPAGPALPRAPSFMSEFREVPRMRHQAETSGAPAVETPGTSAPRAVPAPVFQELRAERPLERAVPHFEPRDASPAALPRREVPDQAPNPGPYIPSPARDHTPMVARILAPIAPRSWPSEERFAAAAVPREKSSVAYPWNEEPAVWRQPASEQEPPEDLSTLIERSWPGLTEKEEQQQAQPTSAAPERPEIRWSGPWPDLPEADPPESAEAGALLRQWERLSRLDREQRGE